VTRLSGRRDFLWSLAAANCLEAGRPFRIRWREGPEYPLGIQDAAFALLDGRVIPAGGFTR
jgi:hypothetical protein